MLYYAKTNTADPRTGFIGLGEFLTEKQTAALGEEKIAELVMAGVLGVSREETTHAKDYAKPEIDTDPDDHAEEEDTPEDAREEDAPELDVSDVIVKDAASADRAETKGRRKSK